MSSRAPEDDLLHLVGSIYATLTGELDWTELQALLCRHLRADWAHLGITQADGRVLDLLSEPDSYAAAYANYYCHRDPFRAVGRAVAPLLDRPVAVSGDTLVPWHEFSRSEYYVDHLRHRPSRHLLGGVVDRRGDVLLGVFRGAAAGAFDAEEQSATRQLLPHLQRAMTLRQMLAPAEPGGLSLSMLDSLPFGLMLLDADLRVQQLNAAGERLLAAGSSGLRRVACPGRSDLLAAYRPAEDTALRALVAAACLGSAGGGMALRPREVGGTEGEGRLAVLVTPAPSAAASLMREGLAPGTALLIARELSAVVSPSVEVLRQWFGLSAGEAGVARALLGGATAEHVARSRQVSVETVRRQIQSVLRKTGAHNLRDFERRAASLPSA